MEVRKQTKYFLQIQCEFLLRHQRIVSWKDKTRLDPANHHKSNSVFLQIYNPIKYKEGILVIEMISNTLEDRRMYHPIWEIKFNKNQLELRWWMTHLKNNLFLTKKEMNFHSKQED